MLLRVTRCLLRARGSVRTFVEKGEKSYNNDAGATHAVILSASVIYLASYLNINYLLCAE